MNDLAESRGLADQLSDEIGRIVTLTVQREMREINERVKASVVTYLREMPRPVVEFAPDINIPMQPASVVNFAMDHEALAVALTASFREAFASIKIPAPIVTINPIVNVTVERKAFNIDFERNRDGLIVAAHGVPVGKG